MASPNPGQHGSSCRTLPTRTDIRGLYDDWMTVKLLALASLVAACTHRKPLARAFDEVEPGRWVTVHTTAGTFTALAVQTGAGVGYQAEGGGWIDPATITRVTDERTLRGAGEGVLIGGGIGVVGGAVLGFADGDDPPCADTEWCLFNMSAGAKAVLGGVLLGGLGVLTGLAVGAVVGSDDVYETSAGVAITPGGPPGSVAGATVTF